MVFRPSLRRPPRAGGAGAGYLGRHHGQQHGQYTGGRPPGLGEAKQAGEGLCEPDSKSTRGNSVHFTTRLEMISPRTKTVARCPHGRLSPGESTPTGTTGGGLPVGMPCRPPGAPQRPPGRRGVVTYRVGGLQGKSPNVSTAGATLQGGLQLATPRPQGLPRPRAASHTLSGGIPRSWQSVESACEPGPGFAWPQSIFEIPHTNGSGKSGLPAAEPPGARAHSH